MLLAVHHRDGSGTPDQGGCAENRLQQAGLVWRWRGAAWCERLPWLIGVSHCEHVFGAALGFEMFGEVSNTRRHPRSVNLGHRQPSGIAASVSLISFAEPHGPLPRLAIISARQAADQPRTYAASCAWHGISLYRRICANVGCQLLGGVAWQC